MKHNAEGIWKKSPCHAQILVYLLAVQKKNKVTLHTDRGCNKISFCLNSFHSLQSTKKKNENYPRYIDYRVSEKLFSIF